MRFKNAPNGTFVGGKPESFVDVIYRWSPSPDGACAHDIERGFLLFNTAIYPLSLSPMSVVVQKAAPN